MSISTRNVKKYEERKQELEAELQKLKAVNAELQKSISLQGSGKAA